MREWPTEHVAKCLVAYHPDDAAELRREQLDGLHALQAACLGTDRELLIEVVPPRDIAGGADPLARALEQIYAAGIRPDWWKLPPLPDAAAWQRITACVQRHDPHCRGVLLLGLEANEDSLAHSFRIAAPHPICKGFAVGRSIFAEPAADWFAGRHRRCGRHRARRRPLRAPDRALARGPPHATRRRAPHSDSRPRTPHDLTRSDSSASA